jgi:CRISPR-associated protein Csd1
VLTAHDPKGKAIKSHKAFAERNLAFFEGLTSNICVAYCNFIKNWNPENETENEYLLNVCGKDYNKNFCFGLEGHPEIMLHDDEQFKQKYQEYLQNSEQGAHKTQDNVTCAITGEVLPIARNHNIVKLYGGNSSGCKIVCMDKDSSAFQSYGKLEAYNSNVSEKAMKIYTSTLNRLFAQNNHHIILGDMTMVYFAMKSNDTLESDYFTAFFSDNTNLQKAEDTEKSLNDKIFQTLMYGSVKDLSKFNIDKDVTFYIVGLTPNNSRVSQKFICRDSFGNVVNNIAQHQKDIAISTKLLESGKPITFQRIFKELVSPKTSKENAQVSSPLMSAIIMSALQGTAYPNALLENVIRRIKTDQDDENNKYIKINPIRVGVVKACINRNLRLNGEKEEFQMSLDLENRNSAYLCGRLFAVLEKIQKDALGDGLNKTIKDTYFASACSTPMVVFPNLIKLSQTHLAVIRKGVKDSSGYYQSVISEIMDKLDGEFPSTLSLEDQGRFIIGYYHQNKDLFTSKKADK